MERMNRNRDWRYASTPPITYEREYRPHRKLISRRRPVVRNILDVVSSDEASSDNSDPTYSPGNKKSRKLKNRRFVLSCDEPVRNVFEEHVKPEFPYNPDPLPPPTRHKPQISVTRPRARRRTSSSILREPHLSPSRSLTKHYTDVYVTPILPIEEPSLMSVLSAEVEKKNKENRRRRPRKPSPSSDLPSRKAVRTKLPEIPPAVVQLDSPPVKPASKKKRQQLQQPAAAEVPESPSPPPEDLPVGFPNPSGTQCYRNASLQALLALEPFVQDLLLVSDQRTFSSSPVVTSGRGRGGGNESRPRKPDGDGLFSDPQSEAESKSERILGVLEAVVKVFRAAQNRPRNHDVVVTALRELNRSVAAKVGRNFNVEVMNDVNEYLLLVLNALSDSIPFPSPGLPADGVLIDPTAKNFGFKVTETLSCEACGMETVNEVEMKELLLDMDEAGGQDLMTYVKGYFKPEKRQLTCEGPKCKGNSAVVRSGLTEHPRIFRMSLKRYYYKNRESRKNGAAVAIPLSFSTADIVDGGRSPSRASLQYGDGGGGVGSPSTRDRGGHEYKLVGIISHFGESTNSGHYTADVFRFSDGRWYNLNDMNIVQVATRQQVIEGNASGGYVFFYMRKDVFVELLRENKIEDDPEDLHVDEPLPSPSRTEHVLNDETSAVPE